MLQAGGNGSPPSVSEGAGRINHTDFRTGRALRESTPLFSASPQRSWSLNPPPCAGLRVAFLNVVNGPPLFPFQRLKTKYSSELGTQPHLGVPTGLRTYSPKARDARRPSTHSCPASSDPHPLWRTVGGRSCRALLAALGGEGRSQRRPGQGSEGWGHSGPALGGAGAGGSSGRSGRRTCCLAVPEAKERWRRVRLKRRRRRQQAPGRRALGQAALPVLLVLAAAAAGSGRLSCQIGRASCRDRV